MPKSQFIRIRRICTKLSTYWKTINQYANHFEKRGYKLNRLKALAEEISKRERSQLLKPPAQTKQPDNRVPLVVTWQKDLSHIPYILRQCYENICRKYPSFKNTFSAPPLTAFRRPPNLSNKIVRANHFVKPNNAKTYSRKTMIDNNMNLKDTIENSPSKRSSRIQNGNPHETILIYAAECIQHKLIYIGETGDTLAHRFNHHHSDIKCYPNRCELPKHFRDNYCCFKKDLEISITEKVNGGGAIRKYKEDKWIMT